MVPSAPQAPNRDDKKRPADPRIDRPKARRPARGEPEKWCGVTNWLTDAGRFVIMRAVRFFPRTPSTAKGIFVSILLVSLCSCAATEEASPERIDTAPLPREALVVATEGETGGRLNYALAGQPGSFNFVNAENTRTLLVTGLISSTLLEFHKRDQVVTGGLMKDWKVSEDARTVTLTIRDGVRFSDGVPLTADDVVFTFSKIYEEGSQNLLRSSLEINGQPLTATRIDSRTVEIGFPEPYAAAEFILTTIPILPKHRLSEPGKLIEEYWHLETPPEEIAGLGPFVLASHEPGRKTVLRYNPHYWRVDSDNVRLPYLDEIDVYYVQDRNSQALRFQAGELDLIDSQLRPDGFLQIQEQAPGAQVINAGASNNLIFCWLNQNSGTNPASGVPYIPEDKRSWFLDVNFRRAFNYAVSREAIIQNVFLGQAREAWTMIPESIPAWHSDQVSKGEYSPEKARDLLRDSGFSWKKEQTREILLDSQGRPVKFSISVRADDFWGRIAAILQQDLEDIGMQVTIKPEEFLSLISRITRLRDYDAALLSFDIPIDPADHAMLLSSSPMHFWHPSQESPATEWERRIDELMYRQTTMLDYRERRRLYDEIQRLMEENVPMIPLANRDVLVAASKRIKNLKPATVFPYTLWNSWELWVE